MRIVVEIIPHSHQRYETCGDWTVSGAANISVKVSETGGLNANFLIAIHEIIEAYLCFANEITTKQVDAFDKEFEENRQKGNEDEPGDDSNAPYKRQHCVATGIERILAAQLGVDWKTYEETLNAL